MSKSNGRMVDIACLVRIADETPLAALRQSIALAARAGAHLKLVLGIQTFVAPYTPFMTSMASSLAAEVNQKAEQKAA